MYCTFFGLQEKPFNVTPDPRFLFLSQAHQEALGHLLYGIEDRKGFIAITGEVGTGKTLLCRALLDRLGRHVRTALILNSFMSAIDLLRSINEDFGIPSAGSTRKELIDTLNAFLLDEFRDGRNAVLIIDEAQNLAPAVLEQIRMLSNLETERGKLLQIVLVGQPELRQQLARPELRQLNQRIALRYHLRPFDRRETSDYIRHRLLVAGSHGGVRFTPRALRAIYRHSQGIARKINLICDRALLSAYVQGTSQIDGGIVAQASAELDDQARPRQAPVGGQRRRWTWRVAPSVGLALALTVGGAWLGYHRPHNLEVAELGVDAPLPTAEAPTATPSADDAAAPTPAPATAPQPERPALLSEGVEGVREAAAHVVAQDIATMPGAAVSAAPQEPTPTGLEGAILLRALLWEYSRAQPQQPEGVKAALTSVAAGFGLEMIALRTDLPRLKRFRLACLVETSMPPVSTPRLLIFRGSASSGIAVMDASGEVRRVSDEEFTQMWSGRVYLFQHVGAAARHILVRGQQGAEVQALQQQLRALGYLPAGALGQFDGETVEAVRRFQRDYALQVDGLAGPTTRILLAHLVGRAPNAVTQP
jgi:general secretion pathway protein A